MSQEWSLPPGPEIVNVLVMPVDGLASESLGSGVTEAVEVVSTKPVPVEAVK